jgi:cation:H+ antiporter
LLASVKVSIIVYITLSNIIGESIGTVTFQKFSQNEAPSMEDASYKAGGIDCSPARKIIICKPEDQTRENILDEILVAILTILLLSPALIKKSCKELSEEITPPTILLLAFIACVATESLLTIKSTTPEAKITGRKNIALTNILGSNIINTLIILGVSATIYPVACKSSTYRIEIPLSALAGIAVLILGTNFFGSLALGETHNGISRIDGTILLIVFIAFCSHTIYQGLHNREENTESFEAMPIWKSLILIVIGLAGLVYGGELIVSNAVAIAKGLGISESVIGVTIVALGTSLPELATSAMAALKKNSKIEKCINVIEPVALVALIVLITAYLVDGSFNPFLYFRF